MNTLRRLLLWCAARSDHSGLFTRSSPRAHVRSSGRHGTTDWGAALPLAGALSCVSRGCDGAFSAVLDGLDAGAAGDECALAVAGADSDFTAAGCDTTVGPSRPADGAGVDGFPGEAVSTTGVDSRAGDADGAGAISLAGLGCRVGLSLFADFASLRFSSDPPRPRPRPPRRPRRDPERLPLP